MLKNGFAEGRCGYRNGGGFTGLDLVKRIGIRESEGGYKIRKLKYERVE